MAKADRPKIIKTPVTTNMTEKNKANNSTISISPVTISNNSMVPNLPHSKS